VRSVQSPLKQSFRRLATRGNRNSLSQGQAPRGGEPGEATDDGDRVGGELLAGVEASRRLGVCDEPSAVRPPDVSLAAAIRRIRPAAWSGGTGPT
jgi:hypothetical protein